MNVTISLVTDRIKKRSEPTRTRYLERMRRAAGAGRVARHALPCANIAHGFAASDPHDKELLRAEAAPNVAIVSAYNDVLSAHQPLERYPSVIRAALRAVGGVGQVAGGVPAMCDGITQGQAGMELSLMSRDIIAMSTAIALSHDMFDAVLCLGVCDKIVPGLLIGALSFGHLPTIFIPAGPMPAGLPNSVKSRMRQEFAAGRATRAQMLDVESQSYHAAGTCNFYGTANSNQMLMEVMGLHLPGASFVNPGTPLREALTVAAAQRIVELTHKSVVTPSSAGYTPLCEVIDERAIVNGVVGLVATGGSTNLTLHLVAIAAAAGVRLTLDDFAEVSRVVPLIASVYPNGEADVNQFRDAGGLAFVISQLLDAGLLHADARTVFGAGLAEYRRVPAVENGRLCYADGPSESRDTGVVRPCSAPFSAEGGLRVLSGNLGRAVIKVSAVKPEHRRVQAPAMVFDSQEALLAAFAAGAMAKDFVAVVRWQGPSANGMPELHKMSPPLGILQDAGHRVAMVTDGRMSGASGKVPAAIHVCPECKSAGPLARVRNGDLIRLDAEAGVLEALVDPTEWQQRVPDVFPSVDRVYGIGRELFSWMRASIGDAEHGASALGLAAFEDADDKSPGRQS